MYKFFQDHAQTNMFQYLRKLNQWTIDILIKAKEEILSSPLEKQ